MKKKDILLLLCLLSSAVELCAVSVKRAEPLCWWEGMRTELQIMLYGENLSGAAVRVKEDGMSVKAVHEADSRNYLFLDMAVEKAGKYTIELMKDGKKVAVDYEVFPRREGSAERKGICPSDVIYLIMPDRFANGDESNDKIDGSEQELDRSKMDVRHGGDIQGIIDHLDYLSELGVTSIWSTPLLEDNQFYHHYAISDYYRIDPHFGTNGLYRKLVAEAHAKGLKIIQDVVPNHCGSGHWWMADLPFTDWVTPKTLDYSPGSFALQPMSDVHAAESDVLTTGKTWLYECMPDMNLDNPFVLKYLSQMAIWWVEYADLDALRVDTYFYMGRGGSLWTKNIRNEYPEMRFVGEVWGDNPSLVSFWVGDYKKHNGFASNLPMAMDFPLQRGLIAGLATDNALWGGSTKAIYDVVAQDFLYREPNRELVVFADNHDMDRVYNMLGKNMDKVKSALALVMTMRGTPQVYYGTELLFENAGRGGAHQNRPDFPGGWKSDATDLFRAENRSVAQEEMFCYLQTLLRFRSRHSVVYEGNLMHYVPENNVYALFRYDDKECVMTLVNGSEKETTVDLTRFGERLGGMRRGADVVTGKEVNPSGRLAVGGYSAAVVHFE